MEPKAKRLKEAENILKTVDNLDICLNQCHTEYVVAREKCEADIENRCMANQDNRYAYDDCKKKCANKSIDLLRLYRSKLHSYIKI